MLLIDTAMAAHCLGNGKARGEEEREAMRLICVMDEETPEADRREGRWKDSGVETILFLSGHPGRAKDRLEAALRGKLVRKASSARVGNFPKREGFRLFKNNFSSKAQPSSPKNGISATKEVSRYILAHSTAGKSFRRQLTDLPLDAKLAVLGGVTGSEFELAARELHYLRFGEEGGPYLPQPEELTLVNLEEWEKNYQKEKANGVCYVGLIDDLPHEKVEVVQAFVEFLHSLRNPSLTLLMGRELDHEFRTVELAGLCKKWEKANALLRIPSLGERPEDVAPLANNLISQLRNLHPFLACRSFDQSGYKFLQKYAKDHSWEGFCGLIRSAAAVSSKTILGEKELEPFKDPSLVVSHIIESQADEVYFPN
ncbi:MAG: hypothetical protein JJT75_13070 [Opitutales bacterium]|nr:hypothetical protein [Opitutales bacterium]MCH8540182.1 hypothetical protein [Opitutales bacterium]